MGTYAMITS